MRPIPAIIVANVARSTTDVQFEAAKPVMHVDTIPKEATTSVPLLAPETVGQKEMLQAQRPDVKALPRSERVVLPPNLLRRVKTDIKDFRRIWQRTYDPKTPENDFTAQFVKKRSKSYSVSCGNYAYDMERLLRRLIKMVVESFTADKREIQIEKAAALLGHQPATLHQAIKVNFARASRSRQAATPRQSLATRQLSSQHTARQQLSVPRSRSSHLPHNSSLSTHRRLPLLPQPKHQSSFNAHSFVQGQPLSTVFESQASSSQLQQRLSSAQHVHQETSSTRAIVQRIAHRVSASQSTSSIVMACSRTLYNRQRLSPPRPSQRRSYN